MPTHTNHVGSVGPVISVGLSVSIPFAMLGLGGPPGTYNALVDSGANVTAISPSVQAVLRAQRRGRRVIQRPDQQLVRRPVVDLRLRFEGHLANFPWFDLSAVVTPIATPGIDVLIGADVLSQVVFTWDGPQQRFTIVY